MERCGKCGADLAAAGAPCDRCQEESGPEGRPPSVPPTLKVHQGGGLGTRSGFWHEPGARDPDLTPLPGSALAVAAGAPLAPAESGTQPVVQAPVEGQIVHLRPQDETATDPKQLPAPPARATESTADQPERPPVAKPILASESLQEDLEPTEPGTPALRVAAGLGGAVAAVTGIWVGSGSSLVGAALTTTIAVTALSPLRYTWRAAAVLAAAVTGLAMLSWLALDRGAGPDTPILQVATMLLAGSLIFRSWYRAARSARALVALGVLLSLLWLVGLGALDGLSTIGTEWQSWLPATFQVALVLLLLLSLLAFMDASTTGGCAIWGWALLGWYVAYASTQWAASTWTAGTHVGRAGTAGGFFEVTARATQEAGATAAAMVLGSVCVVADAVALSQVLAAAAGGAAEPPDDQEPA